MEVVAETLLSSVLDFLIGQLATSDLMKFAREEHVHTELKKWKTELLGIQSQLGEAEEKQITDGNAKSWLNDLRALVYDMEDVLDEFAYEVMRRKLMVSEADEPGTSNLKLCKFIPTCCTSFDPTHTVRLLNMGAKIQEITVRLGDISDTKAERVLKEVIGGATPAWRSPAPTTPIAYEPAVYGRDDDQKAILDMLSRVETYESNFGVISIVGPGGVGKTTLARLIYNNEAAAENFDLKAWACVSDVFHLENITKSILNSVKQSDASGSLDFQQVQRELRNALANKKFLLILDDVWNQNPRNWISLQAPLSEAAKGSKVIVTTRHRNAALMMGPRENLHELKPLSPDACLSVFEKEAFKFRNVADHQNLVAIGKKIVAKCGGLPLAAKALGGLLQAKEREEDWERVLNSKIWQLPSTECEILPPLQLSYHYLPSCLKRCFAYCANFPKDYEFDPKDLVLLWMAEGLIGQPSCANLTIEDQGDTIEDQGDTIEDQGDECFRELFSRSFFQSSGNQDSYFVMHDLIHDLAQAISSGTCLSLGGNLENAQESQIPIGTRHLSFTCEKFHLFKKLEDFQVLNKLRTFVALPINLEFRDVTSLVRDDLMSKFQQLRVLSLSGYMISVLSDSIGGLKHLRYLNLSATRIESLPDSVTNLCNLQTLVLCSCRRLTRLPVDIGNLISLRHLDVYGCPLQEMPQQIGRLKQLQTISNIIVGKRGFLGLKELKDLSNLKGEIRISGLENMLDIQDAKDANLKDKLKIEKLSLIWGEKLDDSHDEGVMSYLQPNTNLKKLEIEGYGGAKFSNWISYPSYSKLVELKLIGCVKCKSIPPVGQLPFLKELFIRGMDGVETIGEEFEGQVFGQKKPFQCLESLQFWGMKEWKEWSWSSQSFSSLRLLWIQGCPKLVGRLPVHLTSLVDLNVFDCPEIVVPIPTDLRSLQKYEHYNFGSKFRYEQGGSGRSVTSSCLKFQVSGISAGLYGELKHSLPSAVELVEIDNTGRLEYEWVNGFGVGNLQSLEILDYKQLESFGEEEEEHGVPLKLSCLSIERCESLRSLPGWIVMRNSNTCTPLEKLEIYSCPSLMGFPRGPLTPTLKILKIEDCEKLVSLPEDMGGMCGLEELYVRKCPSLVGFPKGPLSPNLKILSIENCKNLASLPEDMGGMCGLEELLVEKCPSLVGFPKGPLTLSLRFLNIWLCEKLVFLPENMGGMCGLEILCIRKCPSLVGFPKGPLSPNLKELRIEDCEKLECLPEDMGGICGLEELCIYMCPSLVGFPKGPLSSNLKKLSIEDCENLASLPEDMGGMCGLEELRIYRCPSLICFPKGPLTPNLKILMIDACEKLVSLPEDMGGMCGLEILLVKKCPSLVGFPRGPLIPNLKELMIEDCEKLECLPEGIMLYHPTSTPSNHTLSSALQTLQIINCPSLSSFPSGKFPSTLKTLCIDDCVQLPPISIEMSDPYHNSLETLSLTNYPNLKLQPHSFRNLTSLVFLAIDNIKTPLSELGFAGLTSLTRLFIGSIAPESTFFDHHHHLPLLPTTLHELIISRSQNLESLSFLSLQALTSLRTLCISDCPQLHSFIPKEGLPDMLSWLEIKRCPLLIQRCSEKTGEDWPKIAHIPGVRLWEV